MVSLIKTDLRMLYQISLTYTPWLAGACSSCPWNIACKRVFWRKTGCKRSKCSPLFRLSELSLKKIFDGASRSGFGRKIKGIRMQNNFINFYNKFPAWFFSLVAKEVSNVVSWNVFFIFYKLNMPKSRMLGSDALLIKKRRGNTVIYTGRHPLKSLQHGFYGFDGRQGPIFVWPEF